jgi:hypothetical protein
MKRIFTYGMGFGGWCLSRQDWLFIKEVLVTLMPNSKILEFGAGLSSLLMSEIFPVLTYESDKEWCERDFMWRIIPLNKLEVRYWDGVNGPFSINPSQDEPFALAFVDGPKGIKLGGPGRRHSIERASILCDKVIVHDSGRADERSGQKDFLEATGFKLIGRSTPASSAAAYWSK